MGRKVLTWVVAASTFLGAACSETKTPTEPMTPAPSRSVFLSGRVTDQAGEPQGGIVVICQGQRVTTWGPGGPSFGTFTLTYLRAGKTTLDVYPPGQTIPTSFEVELVPGTNTKNVSITVVHGQPASLSGRIIPQSSRPIAGITLYCQGRSAPVAADGSYALAGLESGTWEILIGWDVYLGEFYTNVTLGPGANTQNFNIPY